MNVLLIGSGGREHALAWALSKSPKLSHLFVAPGNAGIADEAECVNLDVSDHPQVLAFCRERNIQLVVVGPEAPLVAGLADDLVSAGIRVFGPSRAASQLEGSKGFTKDLCARAGIPTAAYSRHSDRDGALAALSDQSYPVVIKADGLAAGKGVIIAENRAEAVAAVDACFDGAFGDAGAEVVIEDFLVGEEASFFALCDGQSALALATAQDHKRIGDGDTGPNTGGMGAYSPAPVMSKEMIERTMAEIIRPTLATMAQEGTPFTGVLYAGLMITAQGPSLIEYNVRFGDPEAQVLLMRLESDLLALLDGAANGRLEGMEATWSDEAALSVVMASKGYPGAYEKNTMISGLETLEGADRLKVFHAGTARRDGTILATGGRVLNVTALGHDIADAQARAYQAISRIDWPNGMYRGDIGWRALARRDGDEKP